MWTWWRVPRASRCAAWLAVAALCCSGCGAKSLEAAVGGVEDAIPGAALLAGVVGVAVVVCGVLLLLGCAEVCRRHSGFKEDSNELVEREPNYSQISDDFYRRQDFDNDESFTPTDVVPSGPAGDFSLYPPVESTPDPGHSGPVIFEPLPDLPGRRHRVSNASALRPKVSSASASHGRERVDSEESLEDIIERDSMQDKLKLQNLLTNSRNQLPRSQLQYIKELGTGYFGKVLQGEGQRILPGHKKTKVVIQMLKEEADPHDQLTFLQEALPYRETEHLNVMKVLGQCVETMPYLVVLELCPFGDLKTYLRSHRVALDSFNERGLLLKFASDMAAGLQALHQGGFVHHDFAIRNCLLSSDLTVKIGDYGMSEEVFKEDYYFDVNGDAVPIRWLAPESIGFLSDGALAVRPVNKDANIWSFGVALWECVQFGALPYSDLSNDHVVRLVIREKSIRLPKPDLPITHLDRLYQLVGLCQSEPGLRPSLRELRIMLLHLLSSKTADSAVDTTAFDTKWNQLMPRKPPQVSGLNSPIQTVAAGVVPSVGHGVSNGVVPQRVPGREASRPGELNLGAGGLLQEERDHAEVFQPKKTTKPETPSNELSLEAELSAAFSATREEHEEDAQDTSAQQKEESADESEVVNLSLDEDIVASSTPKAEDADKKFPELPLPTSSDDHDTEASSVKKEAADRKEGKMKSQETSDSEHEKSDEASSPLHKSEPQEISPKKGRGDGDGTTIILEDESFAGESPVPDIVATSLVKGETETPPDFMTSTPKKPDKDGGGDGTPVQLEPGMGDKSDIAANSTVNTDASHYQSLSDNSASTQLYSTALTSQHSNTSTDTSRDDSAEFSFLGEKKFAALLQTVPSFSYDGDESEMMSSSFGSTDKSGEFGRSLDKSTDDMLVGSSGNVTPTPGDDLVKSSGAVTPSGDENRLLGNESVATLQAADSSHLQQETPLMPQSED